MRHYNHDIPHAVLRTTYMLLLSIILKWKGAQRPSYFTRGHVTNTEPSQNLNPDLSDSGDNIVSRAAL